MLLRIRQEPEAQAGRSARLLPGSLRLEGRAVHAAPSIDGPEVRTCTHGGDRVAFRIDPLGCWAECPLCGRAWGLSDLARNGASWFRASPDRVGTADDERRGAMIAAVGLGLIGTVLVVVLVIVGIMFILRRA